MPIIHWNMRRGRRVNPLYLAGALATLLAPAMAHAVTPGAGTPAAPFKGKFDWLVIRCHASDETDEPESTAYFKQMFTGAGKGTMNMVDWWHDVSFGNIDISGTVVATGGGADAKGWYTLPITKAQYGKLSRTQQVQTCANQASPDHDLGKYYGVLTVYPASDSGGSGGDADSYGPISNTFAGVNGRGGGTFTLSLVNLPTNANPTFTGHEMGHGFGLHHSRLLSTSTKGYGDGYDIMSAMQTFSYVPSGSKTDALYGGSNLGSVVGAKGTGPDAITRDDEGWIPQDRIGGGVLQIQGTLHLHSLSDPKALSDNPDSAAAGGNGELLELTVPAAVKFPFSPPVQNTCVSTYYSIEYREPLGWDAGIPTPASYWNPTSPAQLNELNTPGFPTGSVLIHINCVSGWDPPPPSYDFSLLVDTSPAGSGHPVTHNANFYPETGPNGAAPAGAFYPGDEFADDGNGFYFAVNTMSAKDRDAVVTLAFKVGLIKDKLTLTGPTVADVGGSLAATALLMTDAPAPANNAVVPGHKVTFSLGSEKCVAVTDLDGVAGCTLKVTAPPFATIALSAEADATRAYRAATAKGDVSVRTPIIRPTRTPLPIPRTSVTVHRPDPPKIPAVIPNGPTDR